MIRRKPDRPMPLTGPEREQAEQEALREEALERLIAMLEIAVAQMGWIYRPPMRVSSDRLNQRARLRAAHAAYVLASHALQYRTGLVRRVADLAPAQ